MKDMISWWRTTFGEKEIQNLINSISSEHISQGPVTAEFESRVAQALDIPYVVATTSGSMASLMALMALGIKRDDEVIMPNRAWIAPAHAAALLGAKVVMVDVLPDVPVMDTSQIREKITSRTKAIIPVSLNGHAVDMDEVSKIADEFGICVIEDAAQSFFSKRSGKYMGTISDAGCFSLSVAKLISTGQGGLVVTASKKTYEQLKRIRTHGVDSVIENCIFHQMGFNFRFTDIQASIGLAQLERVPERIAHINEVYSKYEAAIKNIPFLELIPVDVSNGEIPIYIEVLCKERDKLVSFLNSEGIQTRSLYPDLNTASYLQISGQFPNSRRFGEQGVVLPCGPDQCFENIDRVIATLHLFGKKNG